MKMHHAAIAILCAIVLFVVGNSLYITSTVDEYLNDWKATSTPEDVKDLLPKVQAFREEYTRFETYISLTINHEDLMDIRLAIAEMEGCAEGEDRQGFMQAKSRLLDTLMHLRRLNGFSLYSLG